MYIFSRMLGHLIALLGRLMRLVVALLEIVALISAFIILYNLSNIVFPGWAFDVMQKDSVIGSIFRWYYTEIYLPHPLVGVIVNAHNTLLAAVPIVGIISLRNVFSTISTWVYNAGIRMISRSVMSEQVKRQKESAQVASQALRIQKENQQLREENAMLRSRPTVVKTKVVRPKGPSLYQRFSNYLAARAKQADTGVQQDDVWGKWSRKE